MKNKIIVLHEVGANGHYRALKHLLEKNNMEIQYREFAVFRKLVGSIMRLDKKQFVKQIINIGFLLNLLFTKNKKIVLGIAPFDYRLYMLSFFLRKHHIYYHTSWSDWSGSFYPKKLFVNNKIIEFWKKFLHQDVKHIFAVTQSTKNSIIKYIRVNSSKITVVYHSYDRKIYYPSAEIISSDIINFLYVGRLISTKGIIKIIEFFGKNHINIHLTIVGSGELQHEIETFAINHDNVSYKGYLDDEEKLADTYRQAHFLLLPSIKQNNWQELFGMVMIEAMACGVVPLASNHIGPVEVISNGVNGYLMDEDDFEITLSQLILGFDLKQFISIQNNAIKKAKEFSVENISNKWSPIIGTNYELK